MGHEKIYIRFIIQVEYFFCKDQKRISRAQRNIFFLTDYKEKKNSKRDTLPFRYIISLEVSVIKFLFRWCDGDPFICHE